MLNYVSIACSTVLTIAAFALELPAGTLWLAWCLNVLVSAR